MIGGNDASGETFTIADVSTLTWYVLQKQLGGVHFWSFDRDVDCAPGTPLRPATRMGRRGRWGLPMRLLRGWGGRAGKRGSSGSPRRRNPPASWSPVGFFHLGSL